MPQNSVWVLKNLSPYACGVPILRHCGWPATSSASRRSHVAPALTIA